MDTLSTLVGFLMGVATGAAGSYYGTKFTEQRQKKEQKKEIDNIFTQLEKEMPKLFSEMREDLSNPDNSLKRDFVLLKKAWTYNSPGMTLCYYYDDHQNLDDKTFLLEDSGVIDDITETNVKKYRFNSEFVNYLKMK